MNTAPASPAMTLQPRRGCHVSAGHGILIANKNYKWEGKAFSLQNVVIHRCATFLQGLIPQVIPGVALLCSSGFPRDFLEQWVLGPVASGCKIRFTVCQAFWMKRAIKKSHIIMSHCKGQPQYLFCHKDMIQRQQNSVRAQGKIIFLKLPSGPRIQNYISA